MTFNLVLLVCDALLLTTIARFRRVWVLPAIGVPFALSGILTGVSLATDSFDLARLAAYGIFLHTPVVLIGAAVVWRKQHKALAAALVAAAAALPSVAAYAFLIEPHWLEITHYEITSPKLARPLRIVVLADIQTDDFGDFERHVLDEALAQKPDVIFFAGDYLQVAHDNAGRQIQRFNEHLRQSSFAAPQGVFAVQGNVDPGGWQQIFAGLDITVTQSRRQFTVGDARLTCLSLGESYGQGKIDRPDRDAFHIVLGHVPNYALGHVDADLLIAGHTHGGQVRFPLFGAVVLTSVVPRAWVAGMTDLPHGGKLFVSRGIGMERGHAPRLRFLCRPELAVIDVHPALPGGK
jgi:uncharacterized protein